MAQSAHHKFFLTVLLAALAFPPVALIKLIGASITQNGIPLVTNAVPDAQGRWFNSFPNSAQWISGSSRTALRIRGHAAKDGKSSETITLRVDVQDSFDLQYLPLTFKWTTLYPEQHNVTVEREGDSSIYRITAQFDSRLIRKRIPVLLTVNNGSFDSNPAIINFY